MKVFMIGGTGLLGSEAAKVLIERGHEVVSVALPPLPQGAMLPPEMKIDYGNYLEMTDNELRGYFTDCEGFVFAAGVDERVEGPAPIYELYRKYNIDPINRLLKLAKECGVKHAAVCGSYFSYFARTMVTVHQVGQAIAGALEHTHGGKCWPIGYYNMTWKEMLAIMCKHMGCPEKKVTTIPNWMFTMGCKAMLKQQKKQGIEGGLYMPKLAGIQCSEFFIDKSLGCVPLGVEDDDIDAAIGDSIHLCADILDGKVKPISMKGE